jgi:hypothetical protein
MPSSPPAVAITSDSVSSCRTMRPRPAPSDARIAISCSRAVHCAITRMATFAQAMSRVDTTAPAQHPRKRQRNRVPQRRAFNARHTHPELPLRRRKTAGVVAQRTLQLLGEQLSCDPCVATHDDFDSGRQLEAFPVQTESRLATMAANQNRAGITPLTT